MRWGANPLKSPLIPSSLTIVLINKKIETSGQNTRTNFKCLPAQQQQKPYNTAICSFSITMNMGYKTISVKQEENGI